MTESELFQHICSMAGAAGHGPQPPFAPVAIPLHPEAPVDYETIRTQAYEAILGPSDYVFHPPLGAPHIDVERYPPSDERPFWSLVTNGMSDFPQVLPDGSTFRAELICAARQFTDDQPHLLQVLGTFPFRCNTFLHYYNTVPVPDGVGDPQFTYAMTVPPFLDPRLAGIQFLGEPLLLLMVIRITTAERESAVRTSSTTLVESLPDTLDTWLIDGRR